MLHCIYQKRTRNYKRVHGSNLFTIGILLTSNEKNRLSIKTIGEKIGDCSVSATQN